MFLALNDCKYFFVSKFDVRQKSNKEKIFLAVLEKKFHFLKVLFVILAFINPRGIFFFRC